MAESSDPISPPGLSDREKQEKKRRFSWPHLLASFSEFGGAAAIGAVVVGFLFLKPQLDKLEEKISDAREKVGRLDERANVGIETLSKRLETFEQQLPGLQQEVDKSRKLSIQLARNTQIANDSASQSVQAIRASADNAQRQMERIAKELSGLQSTKDSISFVHSLANHPDLDRKLIELGRVESEIEASESRRIYAKSITLTVDESSRYVDELGSDNPLVKVEQGTAATRRPGLDATDIAVDISKLLEPSQTLEFAIATFYRAQNVPIDFDCEIDSTRKLIIFRDIRVGWFRFPEPEGGTYQYTLHVHYFVVGPVQQSHVLEAVSADGTLVASVDQNDGIIKIGYHKGKWWDPQFKFEPRSIATTRWPGGAGKADAVTVKATSLLRISSHKDWYSNWGRSHALKAA